MHAVGGRAEGSLGGRAFPGLNRGGGAEALEEREPGSTGFGGASRDAEVGQGGSEAGRIPAASASRGMVRVALIGHQFQVPTEGQAKAQALASAGGLEVHVVVPDRYREAEVRWRTPDLPKDGGAGVHYHLAHVRLPWSGPAKWYLQSYAGLRRILEAIRPDILDVWEEPWSLLSAQVCRLRNLWFPSARLISETEQNIRKRLPFPFEHFRSYTFGQADFLIGRNAEAVSNARALGFGGPARIVGNGFDPRIFHPSDQEAARRKWGVRGFAVGYAGRCVASKGLRSLLAARDILARLCPATGRGDPPGIWVAGEGPLESELRTTPGVHLPGALSRTDLAQFFCAMDVVVLPSLSTRGWKEQFGRVIVEAQGCGIPVVGSSSGAIPEVLGEPELVYPENDSQALARVLMRLWEDRLWGALMAQEGRKRALRNYSWDAVAAQMREVYLELAPRRLPGGRADGQGPRVDPGGANQ